MCIEGVSDRWRITDMRKAVRPSGVCMVGEVAISRVLQGRMTEGVPCASGESDRAVAHLQSVVPAEASRGKIMPEASPEAALTVQQLCGSARTVWALAVS